MRRDLRDPKLLGEQFLRLRASDYPLDRASDIFVPDFRGDESPLERYGDPRLYDVEVETVIRRVPVIVATRDGSEPARVIGTVPIEQLAPLVEKHLPDVRFDT